MAVAMAIEPNTSSSRSRAPHLRIADTASMRKETAMPLVTHEIDGAVGVVSMAKPPHNLIDDELLDDLPSALC
jgi:hypothetical protein